MTCPLPGDRPGGRARRVAGVRRALVLLLAAVASTAGSCRGTPGLEEGGAGASGSSAAGGSRPADAPAATVARDLSEPILISPDRCLDDGVSGRSEPWSELQVVEVDAGRPVHLRGCESEGESFVRFRYVDRTPVPSLHLFEYDLYEGGGWMLVNTVSGGEYHLSGRPRFSPDRRWFATTRADLEAGYDRNHLDVWSVEADTVRRVLALEGHGAWGGADLRWISTDTIEFLRVTRRGPPTSDPWLDSTAVRVIRSGTQWVPGFSRR